MHRYPKNAAARHPITLLLMVMLSVLGSIPTYSTVESRSMPAGQPKRIACTRACNTSTQPAPAELAATFAPFLNIVPSGDGTEVFIQAGEVDLVGGSVVANLDIGPTHNKGSYTMTYSDTAQAYFTSALGFTPNASESGSINITTTLGLDSGVVDFDRAFVPAATTQTISSRDGNMELVLVSADTIAFDTYVAIVPSFSPPGAIPAAHRLVGTVYSVRAADALVAADKPMNLRLHYDPLTLGATDPHTLAIFGWDAFNKRWQNIGGRLNVAQQYLSVATARFGTYALLATPTWRDDFNDISGLDASDNVFRGAGSLVLLSSPGDGTATSKPITPPTAPGSWGTVTFTATVAPPTTSLTVDVLSASGVPLLTHVASGADLSAIDPAQHSSLKLRANLHSTAADQTPALDAWKITWNIQDHKLFIPAVLR